MGRERRSPLVVRGARQVGKTSLIRDFARKYFSNCLEINFEKDKEFKAAFEDLKVNNILRKLESLSGIDIRPGETLLFLDEIQDCVNAISALRYFKEDYPGLHVIAVGSLLEFALEEKALKMPVGRIEFSYMYPLSFTEFLVASKKESWLNAINQTTILQKDNDLPLLHDGLMALLKDYFLVGGMPDSVETFLDSGSHLECQRVQRNLLVAYEADFSKYAGSRAEEHYIQAIYEQVPGAVAEQFKYAHVVPDAQARSVKPALMKLLKAQVLHRVLATTAGGLPLDALVNKKKFKILMSDIGLYSAALNLSKELLLSEDIVLVNKGTLAEQFVGQEIIANAAPTQSEQLHFWSRDVKASRSEVDYVISVDGHIIPVEVKAGKTGRLKSLHIFMKEKKSPIGLRLGDVPLSFEGGILNVPLYMASEVRRLVADAIGLSQT